MWSNFHTHTNFCDGKGAVADFLFTAEQSGMASLGFSSHAPLPFDRGWSLQRSRYDDYLLELHLAKQTSTVQVYSGLEIDYLPGQLSPSSFKNDLDYTIGSVHFVDTFPDGSYWEIDSSYKTFCDGLSEIFGNDIRAAIGRYFGLIRELIEQDPPSVIGHLDKIKIHNQTDPNWDEGEDWYIDQIEETLEGIQKAGVIVEVNTRGVYQKKTSTVYPSPWILERIHNKQIPVTLSSDAHRPDDLVKQFEPTAQLLREIGFKELSVLHDGEWKPYAFNEQGIILSN